MKLIETVVNAVTSSMRSQRLRKGGAAEDEPADAEQKKKVDRLQMEKGNYCQWPA